MNLGAPASCRQICHEDAKRFGVRQPSRLRGATERRFGAPAAGAFEANQAPVHSAKVNLTRSVAKAVGDYSTPKRFASARMRQKMSNLGAKSRCRSEGDFKSYLEGLKIEN